MKILLLALAMAAQKPDTAAYTAAECPSCAEWNTPAPARNLFGNTYYVGTEGLAAILVTSDQGHVLLDAGLPESAPLVMASIRALGFRVEDVRLIVNSHPHSDHAGGIAAVQRVSGAAVVALRPAAAVLRTGRSQPGDPQHGILLDFPPVPGVRVMRNGQLLRVGQVAITVHATPGHTPGSTSFTWRSCEGEVCRDFVYADSQTPVSAPGFRYTGNAAWPTALADFARGQAVIEGLACDILITPHPGASRFWQRMAGENGASLYDPEACRRYAAAARQRLAQRVATER